VIGSMISHTGVAFGAAPPGHRDVDGHNLTLITAGSARSP